MSDNLVQNLKSTRSAYIRQRDELSEKIAKLEHAIEGVDAILRYEGAGDVRFITSEPLAAEKLTAPRIGANQANLIDTIRGILSQLPRRFTVRDVTTKLSEVHPEQDSGNRLASVSSSLRRLAELNEIEMIERGQGKRASVFALPVSERNPLSA